MEFIISFVVAYLLGSINSAILVGRVFKNIDIREHGSGNAGATNVLRTIGKTAAIIVLVVDVLKGIVSVVLGIYLGGFHGSLVAGLGAVIGHNFPLYFGFKGGKGILTSAGVLFMIDWKVALIFTVIAIGIMAITRYVSLGSIIGAGMYPIIILIFYRADIWYVIFAICLGGLAIYRHKANIERLLSGTESKLGKTKTKDKE